MGLVTKKLKTLYRTNKVWFKTFLSHQLKLTIERNFKYVGISMKVIKTWTIILSKSAKNSIDPFTEKWASDKLLDFATADWLNYLPLLYNLSLVVTKYTYTRTKLFYPLPFYCIITVSPVQSNQCYSDAPVAVKTFILSFGG